MSTSISQHFSPWSLLKFTFPSIIMMMFMSLYTIVDGIFISRFIGSNALSSLNIVYPVASIVIAIGTMLATGGNAVISRYLGEEKIQLAKECLSLFTLTGFLLSLLMSILSLLFPDFISRALGANDLLLADCRTYLSILMGFAPACMLQTLFQSYLVTAGAPHLGLFLTMIAGIINAGLDYVLIVSCDLGIAGAALATGLGQMVPALAGLVFFLNQKHALHLTRFTMHTKELIQACYNGSSEMVNQLSNAVITFLFNIILMRLAGPNGVAAITILLYGQFLFNAFYLGFSIGTSPIVGYQYGAGNRKELKSIYRISFRFVSLSSVIIAFAAVYLSTSIVTIFTDDPKTHALAVTGFGIFAYNFLFSGFNIASSGFFTALSDLLPYSALHRNLTAGASAVLRNQWGMAGYSCGRVCDTAAVHLDAQKVLVSLYLGIRCFTSSAKYSAPVSRMSSHLPSRSQHPEIHLLLLRSPHPVCTLWDCG